MRDLSAGDRQKLQAAIERFTRFNGRPPKKVVVRRIDLAGAFINIGPMPEVTYQSNKEGTKQYYRHKTNEKNPPHLFWNPRGNFGLVLPGSMRVQDWLYD